MEKSQPQTAATGKAGFMFAMSIICLILILLGVAYSGMHYFVNTRDGLKIYPKKTFKFQDTYVDMTTMTFFQLRNHTDVVMAMTENGDLKYVPGGPSLKAISQAGQNIAEAIRNFDDEYQLSNSLSEASRIGREKYNKLDEKYGVSSKAKKAKGYLKDKAGKLNSWLKKR